MDYGKAALSEMGLKSDKTYVDTQISAVNASPKGVYTTVPALQSALPTGNNNIYLVTGNVMEVDNLNITAAPTASGNVTVGLNGVAVNVAVTIAVAEVDTLTITAAATAAGNVTVTLNGVATNVAVALNDTIAAIHDKIRAAAFAGWTTGGTAGAAVTFTSTTTGPKIAPAYNPNATGAAGNIVVTTAGVGADDVNAVATKIRNTNFSGWTTGGSAATVTFTATTSGARTAPSYSAGSTGATGTMSVTTAGVGADGKWYYWNGSAWTAGGVYQSTGIPLYSLNQSQMDFPAVAGKYGTKNLFDKSTVTNGYYVERNDGILRVDAAMCTSDWIAITPSTAYTLSENTSGQLAFYNSSKVYVSGLLTPTTFTTPSTAYFVRISTLLTKLDTQQLELGSSKTSYEGYKRVYMDLTNGITGNDFLDAILNSSVGGNFAVSSNLFNKSTATSGKYVERTTGVVGSNASYYASDFIAITPSTAYVLSGSDQLAFYDASKVYVSGLLNPTTFTTPATSYFVRASILASKVDTAMLVTGSALPTYIPYGYIINSSRIPVKQFKGVITVAKVNGDFTTISEAVANAGDSSTNPVTILIYPGTYKESVKVAYNRFISLIGVNKDTCIIREDTGDYANNPLRFEGTGRVENLTLMSTVVDGASANPYGYAIHSDEASGYGNTNIVVKNCRLISYVSAAYGIGLQQDNTIEISNCELISHASATSGYRNYGSLFCHSSNKAANVTGQKLIVKNCTGYADYGKALQIMDAGTGTIDAKATFINNMFYNYEVGKVLAITAKTTGNLSGQINLTPDSYGNNIVELNA